MISNYDLEASFANSDVSLKKRMVRDIQEVEKEEHMSLQHAPKDCGNRSSC